VEQLQRRRDRFVAASIPGWVSMAVVLPKLLQEAFDSSEPIEFGLKIAGPLSILAGWGLFEAAEYTELARLKVIDNLHRAGEDVAEMLIAGKFPWVRHFADSEPTYIKIPRLLRERRERGRGM